MPFLTLSFLFFSLWYYYSAYPSSDIDIYMYNLSPEKILEKIHRFHNFLLKKHADVLVVRTKLTITFVCGFPTRHIQFGTSYASLFSFLLFFVLSIVSPNLPSLPYLSPLLSLSRSSLFLFSSSFLSPSSLFSLILSPLHNSVGSVELSEWNSDEAWCWLFLCGIWRQNCLRFTQSKVRRRKKTLDSYCCVVDIVVSIFLVVVIIIVILLLLLLFFWLFFLFFFWSFRLSFNKRLILACQKR